MPDAIAATAAGDRACAPGSAPKKRAHAAKYAAHQPASCARSGPSGGTSAARSARASIASTTGAAATFAGIESNGTAWKWSHAIGAVQSPQAAEIATTSAAGRGTG